MKKKKKKNFSSLSIFGARADDDHIRFVRIEAEAVFRDPFVDGLEAVVQSELFIVITEHIAASHQHIENDGCHTMTR